MEVLAGLRTRKNCIVEQPGWTAVGRQRYEWPGQTENNHWLS